MLIDKLWNVMGNIHDASVFVFGTALVLCTPGPTNTLLAAAGSVQGVSKSISLVCSELIGYLLAITLWGVLSTPLEQSHPEFLAYIRFTSSIYLAFLAIKIWLSARELSLEKKGAISPKTLLVATLLNPKALFFSAVTFPRHTFDRADVYCATVFIFSCLLVPVGLLWTYLGSLLGKGRIKSLTPSVIQRTFAMLIGAFSAALAWTTLH